MERTEKHRIKSTDLCPAKVVKFISLNKHFANATDFCRFNLHIFVACLLYFAAKYEKYMIFSAWNGKESREQMADALSPPGGTADGCACKYPSKNRNFRGCLGFVSLRNHNKNDPFHYQIFGQQILKSEDQISSVLPKKNFEFRVTFLRSTPKIQTTFWEFMQLLLDTEEVAVAKPWETPNFSKMHFRIFFVFLGGGS